MANNGESKQPQVPDSKKEASNEESSLMDEFYAAYGTGSHATFVKSLTSDAEAVLDYEPLKLSSFRVFFLKRGTILANPVLFSEQMLLTFIFAAMAIPVYIFFKEDAAGSDFSIGRFLRMQENKMRKFAMIMTGLAAFLLSFYTSVCVSRWWTMRTAGVGAIKAAIVDLQMLISNCCRTDDSVLDAIERYGRVSLMLIFLWRQKELEHLKEIFSHDRRNLLTPDECDRLCKCREDNPKCALHEVIWAWQTGIVNTLYKQGKITSEQLYILLLEKCTEGRAAVQCVHTHLAVRVPMQYVHLLGFLVKMHNIVVAVIMGLLFGASLRTGHVILCVQLYARTLILPFLFNAILLINCDLSDPFNGGEADFPGDAYQHNLGLDCKGVVEVARNCPKFLKDPIV
jgi:hypothetical protein